LLLSLGQRIRLFTRNGNPYFTNLLCKEIFRRAFANEDSYVDIHSVDDAIKLIVNSSDKEHFEHFWGDGLTQESDTKKEAKTDVRRRILISYGMTFQHNKGLFPSKSEILKNFQYPLEYTIEKYEIENTINEFFNRKIFYEINNSIRLKPQLFEDWLCGPGKSLMIVGISDLETYHRERQLELEYSLKIEELKRLGEKYFFQGHRISVEKFKEYFEQFGSSIDQRRIFKLIDSVYYVSQEEINNFFRDEQKNIFKNEQIEVAPRIHTVFREGVEIFTFNHNIEEKKPIFESFKIMSRLRTSRVLRRIPDK